MSPLSCWTDTAARLTATKAVAADANTTAIDVLERLGELNLHLHGLQKNYSQLEDTVSAANQMIQDPEKNSEIPFSTISLLFWTSLIVLWGLAIVFFNSVDITQLYI